MIKFILLVSRQGKVRLAKFYVPLGSQQKARMLRDICHVALRRGARLSNIVELNGEKYICRRYASLFFIACIDGGRPTAAVHAGADGEPPAAVAAGADDLAAADGGVGGSVSVDNELLAIEVVHHFVEVLDRYFGNVCELDLIFNFHRAYFLLDEVLLAGQLQESSKAAILETARQLDLTAEASEEASVSAERALLSTIQSTFSSPGPSSY
ncbi:clathrin coat assembly protein AP19 [Strigomonas culicis]|uniref:AP complex subunit sigma n=1 Tax=Strigomonas culicis TaxID=28005 RepID=S9UGG2_9TRYP|nr:clathrin coat assembly protein AP19 [Strigomonas culicis]|eukprot:EPY27839.1 clathrin coat assembly protein AP19 [Strigomonas culicis]